LTHLGRSAARGIVSGALLGLLHAAVLGLFGLWQDLDWLSRSLGWLRYLGFGALLGLAVALPAQLAVSTLRVVLGGARLRRRAPIELLVALLFAFVWALLLMRAGLSHRKELLTAGLLAASLCAALLAGTLRSLRPPRREQEERRVPRRIAWALLLISLAAVLVPLRRLGQSPAGDVEYPLEALRATAIEQARGEAPLQNLLLISFDTLRADRLGCYGYDRPTSPHLDSLALRGVLFEQAICPRPKTSPSVASMLTGTYPARHGIHTPMRQLGEANVTLAELLGAAGFATGASITNGNLYPEFGFQQGFDSYLHGHKDGATGARKAVEWLDANASTGERFFFWLHITDPHTPYDPPPPYDEMFGKDRPEDRYDGEIRYSDEQLRRIFAWLDAHPEQRARTLVVFTSDHGESMGEHGEWYEHGLHGYEEAARVPLIFAAEGRFSPGARRQAVVSLVDLVPTILDLFALPLPETVQGKSFLPLLLGLSQSGPRAFALCEAGYGEHIGPGRTRILRRDGSKYIQRLRAWAQVPRRPLALLYAVDAGIEGGLRPDEYYDLRNDPLERNDLRAAQPAIVRRERAQLEAFVAQLVSSALNAGAPNPDALDPSTTEALRSLGYVE
jgi:arylsulfatase A-like enzyme